MSLLSKLYRGLSSRTFSRIVLVTLLCLSFLFLPYVGHREKGTPTAHASVVGRTPASNSALSGPGSGLVGWWTFDGKDVVNGVIRDMSGNGNNGTPMNISSSTFYAPGKIGQAGKFDGAGSKVTTNFDAGGYSQFTASVWFKQSSRGVNSVLLAQWEGGSQPYEFYISSNGILYVSFSTTNIFVGSLNVGSIPLDAWNQLVVIYEGSNVAVYINGVQKNQAGATGPVVTGGSKLQLGGLSSYSYFSGSIDDVRIYNRALSAAEVKQLYLLGQVKLDAPSSAATSTDPLSVGLVGWWTFDGKDVVNGVIRDMSGNGNNGTPMNISSSTFYAPGKIGQAGKFDGMSNTYVTVNGNSALAGFSSATWSIWIKPGTQIDNPSSPFSASATGYYRFLIESGNFKFQYGTVNNAWATSFDSGVSYTAYKDKWTHLSVTYDSAVPFMKFYINGVQINTSAIMSGNIVSGSPIIFFGQDSATVRHFSGSLDDVRIYNRALSATEVKQLYLRGQTTMQATPPVASSTNSLSSGLVGWWTFNNQDINWRTNTAIDRSGNGNNGTLVNMSTTTSPVAGKLGQGLKFDGVGSYVNLPSTVSSDISKAKDFSVSMWFKVNSVSVNGTLIGSAVSATDRTYIQVTSNGEVAVMSYSPGLYVSNAVVVNRWYHLVMIKTGSTVKGYLNNLSMSGVNNPSTNGATNITTLGASNAPLSNYFNGSLDDVRIYNRALSASEVTQLYNMGR